MLLSLVMIRCFSPPVNNNRFVLFFMAVVLLVFDRPSVYAQKVYIAPMITSFYLSVA